MNHLKLITILTAPFFAAPATAQAGSGVLVNGQTISDAAVHALEQIYRTTVPDSQYWYDPVSGLWGLEGSPGIGQIAAGMNLGRRLSASASGYNRGTAGGSLMSDGDCYGYLHPDGTSVLGGNC